LCSFCSSGHHTAQSSTSLPAFLNLPLLTYPGFACGVQDLRCGLAINETTPSRLMSLVIGVAFSCLIQYGGGGGGGGGIGGGGGGGGRTTTMISTAEEVVAAPSLSVALAVRL
jgi:hypothetical protein